MDFVGSSRMELTVSILMQFIATIIAAGFGSWIASQLGRWQFRSQRWWDKKDETYLSIIDGFHPLLDEEEEYWNSAQRKVEIPEKRRIELEEKVRNALAEIHKRRILASFLISAEADDALQEMQRGLNHAKMEMDWTAYMEKWSGALDNGFNSLKMAAAADLGVRGFTLDRLWASFGRRLRMNGTS
jgi:hypothetical protein